jgi:hypothetical protein
VRGKLANDKYPNSAIKTPKAYNFGAFTGATMREAADSAQKPPPGCSKFPKTLICQIDRTVKLNKIMLTDFASVV